MRNLIVIALLLILAVLVGQQLLSPSKDSKGYTCLADAENQYVDQVVFAVKPLPLP